MSDGQGQDGCGLRWHHHGAVSRRVRAHACARAQLRVVGGADRALGDGQPQSAARERAAASRLRLAVFMVFAAGLYRIIRHGEGERGWLAMASLATVVAGAGIFGAGTAVFMVVAYRPGTDPDVARAFWDAGWMAYNSSGFAFGAWITIVVVAAFRHRVLPSWTAWIGIPLALISLVGPFAVKAGTGPFSPQGWFAVVVGLTFAVWLLVVSFAAWRSGPAPAY